MKKRTPADLAERVSSVLKNRRSRSPSVQVLTELFEIMYFSSLRTEESQPITFHIVYLDPRNPDPEPPGRIVQDRWNSVRLQRPIPATIDNLVKAAKASDPRTSSLAVYSRGGHLIVWGLIDQGNRYYDFVNYDSDSGPERPGLFQASILGIGHLVAYIGYERIAELRGGTLVRSALDVLRSGPVRKALEPGIERHREKVLRSVPESALAFAWFEWKGVIESDWVECLCRLLVRIQSLRHGGAVLITPDQNFKQLNIKYPLNYRRLCSALETRAKTRILKHYTGGTIFDDYIDTSSETMPVGLYLAERRAEIVSDENNSELDGALWFVSLLSRVDGLVLLSQSLEVKGFGVEIAVGTKPSKVFMAQNRSATRRALREMDYEQYGTRHRSMMRYCSKVPGSVGFVVSQDGDVRAITKVNGQLVLWDNLQLRYRENLMRQTRKK